MIVLDLAIQLLRGSVERSSRANFQLGLGKEDARSVACRQRRHMASQAIVSRPTRSDKENIRSQGVVDRQGRPRRAKGWPKEGISICVFDCPENAMWNGKNIFSFLESLPRSDTAASIREVGKLEAI